VIRRSTSGCLLAVYSATQPPPCERTAEREHEIGKACADNGTVDSLDDEFVMFGRDILLTLRAICRSRDNLTTRCPLPCIGPAISQTGAPLQSGSAATGLSDHFRRAHMLGPHAKPDQPGRDALQVWAAAE